MDYQNYRITKLRDYLFGIINALTTNRNYQINADMLSDQIGDYSIDKIPTNTEVEKWVIGIVKRRDVYSFKSRKSYSQDAINNLKNIGFFEEFEKIIKSNNDKGVLPEIDDIESIKCLNCGTLNNIDGTQATFDIQIEVTYREKMKEE
jgi:hypothetical protein